jgi:hypothetical protein
MSRGPMRAGSGPGSVTLPAGSAAARRALRTPAARPDPSDGADREDLQSPFDRLTERMLDALPARGSEP